MKLEIKTLEKKIKKLEQKIKRMEEITVTKSITKNAWVSLESIIDKKSAGIVDELYVLSYSQLCGAFAFSTFLNGCVL